ncbi:MAG: secondary thiamine-phosphate synthase enzyme YjbQ [Bacteroidia bacterium]|nr:secondary thiamine-phosphate synthase enzyme YjbQ [Bacteroidia bacterium]MBT8230469.1 secondary thiamine-phosphate synthase enzyme YjbQ [Bacteroidia bacterium]NNK90346.1 YjbQ family protein [Saprospiraceae bacterium]
MIKHYDIRLPAFPRGFHIITRQILEKLVLPDQGLLHLFIKHTSAGLSINENADPDVLTDFESIMNHVVPENLPFLRHTLEGPDDMPAHVKASFVGSSVSIPIINSNLDLGTWQGIYLCEFRNHGGPRKLVATIYT